MKNRLISRLTPRRVAAVSLLLFACATATLVWVAGSEYVLRSLVQRAVVATAGKLAVSGVHGSLGGELRIDKLSYATEFNRVEAQQLELDWSLRELLLHRRLHISKLQMRELGVDIIKINPEPLQAPLSLRSPLAVAISDARVKRLAVQFNGQQHELGALQASLNNLDGQYHFSAGVDGVWGKASTKLALPASAPYALEGTLAIAAQHYSANAQIGGTLAAITLNADVGIDKMNGRLQALLTPFRKSLIRQVALKAQNLDPQHYGADFPHADLALDATMQPGSAGGFQGELKVSNSMPGTVDHARLPLRELRSSFAGGFDAMSLRDIHLDLGEAGRFSGSGKMQQQKLHFDLSTVAFNLRGIHSKLKPTRLSGDLHLELASDEQTLQGQLAQQNYHILLDAAQRNAMVEIKQASVMSAGSELAFTGTVPLTSNREFHAHGNLRNFNPKNFGDYPAAAINAEFTAQGSLSPRPQSVLHVSIADSSYRGLPLNAHGDMKIAVGRIWDASLEFDLGANRLTVQGAFGMVQDRMDWRLDAPDIASLGLDFTGQAQAEGEIGGAWNQPAGQFSLSATDLVWNGTQRLARLGAGGTLAAGTEGALSFSAELNGYHGGGLTLDHATIAAQGQRSNHEIELTARNQQFDAHAVLVGSLQGNNGWTGTIKRFDNQGRYPLALTAPAGLSAGPDRFALKDAALALASGTVHIDELALRSGAVSSRGRIEALSVADLLKLAGEHAQNIESTLTLSGKWRVEAADKLNGEFDLWRDQGDLTAPGEIRARLGLNRLTCNLAMVDNRLAGKLVMDGAALGHVAASAETTLIRRGSVWGIPQESRITADMDARMPSVAWASPLLGAHMDIDGAVEAHISAAGTMLEPRLDGEITGEKLKLAYPGQGVYLKDGTLRAALHENQIILKQLVLNGKEGTLSGKGSVTLKTDNPVMQIGFTADKLQLMDRPDRQLALSGSGEVSLGNGRIHVAAKLKADKGMIEWGKGDAPALDPDVVVLGREKIGSSTPTRISLALDFDLGDQFYFKGEGIDARLKGAISLTGKGGNLPSTSGVISVAQGTYFAYGQSLAIERGILNFSGPMDNPGLNIIAMRKNQPVEAGIAITGTANHPQIKLTSNPVVADSEILSWLVLGHGLGSSNGSELNLLQSAASALLSKGNSIPLQNRIAHAAGLDELALTGGGGLEGNVLAFGKRLSSRAYLSYEQGLTGLSNVAKISYTLTKRLSIKAQAGTESALDLFYEFTFD